MTDSYTPMPPNPQPIYTPANCNPAYQLNWTLSVFWKTKVPKFEWLDALRTALEKDNIRLLEHHFRPPSTSQFLLSTRPDAAPQDAIRLVKGRLQHVVRSQCPKAFRRNYGMYSVGTAKQEVVDRYVASQLGHHRMADQRVQKKLEGFQYHAPDVDLAAPRRSSHGEFIYNLHLVLVNDERWMEIRDSVLAETYEALPRISRKKGHLLSRTAVLADHVHLTLGAGLGESPEAIALCYLNNLAFVQDMRPVFQFGYYVGTFGTYDLGAIRQTLDRSCWP